MAGSPANGSVCLHCKKPLPTNFEGACPYCGKRGLSAVASGRVGVSVSAETIAREIHEIYERDWRFMAPIIALMLVGPILVAYVGGIAGAVLGIVVDFALGLVVFFLHRKAETKVREIIVQYGG
jgi:RNA polymerase subunit RPABC4/transcription elongation factor Spt4